jgi:hypothetical protein
MSGVIFGLIVIDNHHSASSQRSIFGLFSVPSSLYPYVLLVVWQVIMPSASFLGHLCGVLVSAATLLVMIRLIMIIYNLIVAVWNTSMSCDCNAVCGYWAHMEQGIGSSCYFGMGLALGGALLY